jgi:8-oxo-dGTP diphosphatase
LGAATLIEEDDRILLVRRAYEPFKGWWSLPAGFVEYGENAEEAAAREALEETGLVVAIEGVHGIFWGGGDPRGASHLAVFLAKRLEGDPTPGDDAAEVGWFGRDEVPAEIAFEGSRKAIGAWMTSDRARRREASVLRYASSGPAPPILVYAVIENPKGTVNRITYDVARHTFSATGEVFPAPLPFHYGWIPHTLSLGDGRELDVVVIGEGETAAGSALAVRPIGALLRGDRDHKVVALRADIPSSYVTITDVAERPELREMLEEVFRQRRAEVVGWATASETRRLILEAQRDYIVGPDKAAGRDRETKPAADQGAD